MRRSPSIVPLRDDQEVYLVLDDFGGRNGAVWRETNVKDTDLETVISGLLEDRSCNPVRVIRFNTAEGWSQDVSEAVAHEPGQRCADEMRAPPVFLQGFVRRYETPKGIDSKSDVKK